MASVSPIAAPSMPAICALCPHAWAAPVTGSAIGCPATTSPSSSPSSAKLGPSLAPRASAFTPVIARPVFGVSPRPASVSSTIRAVLNSLNPSSGLFRMVSPIETIWLARLSMASQTLFLTSSRVGIARSFRVRPYPPKRSRRNGVRAAGARPVVMVSAMRAAVMGASTIPLR